LALVDLAEHQELPRGMSVASVGKLALDEAARACAEASKRVGRGSDRVERHAGSSNSSTATILSSHADAGAWPTVGLAELKQVHRLGYLVCRVLSLIVPDAHPAAAISRLDGGADNHRRGTPAGALQTIELSLATGQSLLGFAVHCGALLDVTLIMEDDDAAAAAAAVDMETDAAFEPLALVAALRRVFAQGLLQPSLEALLDLVVALHTQLNPTVRSGAIAADRGAAWALGPFTGALLVVLLDECAAACGRSGNARRSFERACALAPLKALLAAHQSGAAVASRAPAAPSLAVGLAVGIAGATSRGGRGQSDVAGAVERLLRVAVLPSEMLPGLQALAALHFKEQQLTDPPQSAAQHRASTGEGEGDGAAAAGGAAAEADKKRHKRPTKAQGEGSCGRMLAEHAESYQWRLVTALGALMRPGDGEAVSPGGAALGYRGACVLVDLFAEASFEAGRARAALAATGGLVPVVATTSGHTAAAGAGASASAATAAAAAAAVMSPLKRRRVTAASEEAAAARTTFELFSALDAAAAAAAGLLPLTALGALPLSAAPPAAAAAFVLAVPTAEAAAGLFGASPEVGQLAAWACGLECEASLLRAVQRAGAYRLHEDSDGHHLAVLARCASRALAAAQAALVKDTTTTPPPHHRHKGPSVSRSLGLAVAIEVEAAADKAAADAAAAVAVAAFRSCGALLELSHLSLDGRLHDVLRLALVACLKSSSSGADLSTAAAETDRDPGAALLARGLFDSRGGASDHGGRPLGQFSTAAKAELGAAACGLLCRVARTYGALRQLPALLAALLRAAQVEGPAMATAARRLLTGRDAPLRRALAAAASRAPPGQVAEGTAAVSDAVAAALLGDAAGGSGASAAVCSLALDVASVWFEHWPVRSPANAAAGSAAAAKAAAAPLSEPLRRIVAALAADDGEAVRAAAVLEATARSLRDWRLGAGLRWYSLLLRAAQGCEAWLARGADEPPTPLLLAQHCRPAAAAEGLSQRMDDENERSGGKEKEGEASEKAASGWDEGRLLGGLLEALRVAEPFPAATADEAASDVAEAAVALAAGELALVRLHQLHASIGALPLLADRAAAQVQGAAWRREATQLLDFLLLGRATTRAVASGPGAAAVANATPTPSKNGKKSKAAGTKSSTAVARAAYEAPASTDPSTGHPVGGWASARQSGGLLLEVGRPGVPQLLADAARQSPVWAPLAQPPHLLALLQPLLLDALGVGPRGLANGPWATAASPAATAPPGLWNRGGENDTRALRGLSGLLGDASFWEVAPLQAWLPHAALLVAVDLLAARQHAATFDAGSGGAVTPVAGASALALLRAAAAAAAPGGPPVPGKLLDATLAAALAQTAAADGSCRRGGESSGAGDGALGRLGALLAASPLRHTAPHALPALTAAALAVSVACGGFESAAAVAWAGGAAAWTAHLAHSSFGQSSRRSSELAEGKTDAAADLFAGAEAGRAAAWTTLLCRRTACAASGNSGPLGTGLQQAGQAAAAAWLHYALLLLLRNARQNNSSSSSISIAPSKAVATVAAARAREALAAVEVEINRLLESEGESGVPATATAASTPVALVVGQKKATAKRAKTSDQGAAATAVLPAWAVAWRPAASLPLCAALRAVADAFVPDGGFVEVAPSGAGGEATREAGAAAATAAAVAAGADSAASDDDEDELAAAVNAAASAGASPSLAAAALPAAAPATAAAAFAVVWHASGAAHLATAAVAWAEAAADAAAEAADAAVAADAAAASDGAADAWACYAAQAFVVDEVLRVVTLAADSAGEWGLSVRAAMTQAPSLAARPLVDLAAAGLRAVSAGLHGAAAGTAAASLAYAVSGRALSGRDASALLNALLLADSNPLDGSGEGGGGREGDASDAATACVRRAALQRLVRRGVSADQRRSLLAQLAADFEATLAQRSTGLGGRGRSSLGGGDASSTALPLLRRLRPLLLALDACCSGNASMSDAHGLTGGPAAASAVATAAPQPLAAQAFNPGAFAIDTLLESACLAVDQHANALTVAAQSSSSSGRSASACAQDAAGSTECVTLAMECVRLLLGVKGLLHAKHRHVARALAAAAAAARSAEAVSAGLLVWGLGDATTTSTAAATAEGEGDAYDGDAASASAGVNARAAAAASDAARTKAAWTKAAAAAEWALEQAVACVARLLRTHSRLVYAAAPLLAHLHATCFHAVARLVGNAHALTTTQSSTRISSSSSARPCAAPRATLQAQQAQQPEAVALLEVLGKRCARGLARLLAESAAETHQLSLKKHLPSLLLDAVASLEAPGWTHASSSRGSGSGPGLKRELQPGVLACLAALGPREVQLVGGLLPGGRDGAPRALFKQLLGDYTKKHKYTGRH
jgi:hypothetical protein